MIINSNDNRFKEFSAHSRFYRDSAEKHVNIVCAALGVETMVLLANLAFSLISFTLSQR